MAAKKTTKKTETEETSIEAMGFFQLRGLLAELSAKANEDGELSDEDTMALVKAHAAVPEKVGELASTILRLEAFTDYLKKEEDRMKAARKRVERIRERLSQGVVDYIQENDLDDLRGGSYLLSARACPEHVVLDDDFNSLAFTKVKSIENPSDEAVMAAREHGGIIVQQHDRRAITEALKRGEQIPGARLERNYRLEIK